MITKNFLSVFSFPDINECGINAHNCDVVNGNCTNSFGSFICQCGPGYTGNGTTCTGKSFERHTFLPLHRAFEKLVIMAAITNQLSSQREKLRMTASIYCLAK